MVRIWKEAVVTQSRYFSEGTEENEEKLHLR
jgi:hypothetical protein